MNLLCVPNCLSKETIRQILKGGHDKAVEAGCTIAGGHTIQDPEPKYGLCVTGYVHPDKILKNVGAQPGDLLVITKPLGTGVLTTGAKADLVSKEDYDAMTCSHGHLERRQLKQPRPSRMSMPAPISQALVFWDMPMRWQREATAP